MHILIAVENMLLRTALEDYIACMMPDAFVSIAQIKVRNDRPVDVAVIDHGYSCIEADIVIDVSHPGFNGRLLLRACRDQRRDRAMPSVFTAMERQVLRHLIAGMANKEIVALTGISLASVKLSIRKLCARTGARNRTQLALVARRMATD